MLKIIREGQSLAALEAPTFADCSITERYDLQEFITNSPSIFFGEIGQELFLVGKEIVASANVQDRIDILALDKTGAAVVIELKRGNHKLHMLQAISYAGMIAEWSHLDVIQLLDGPSQERLVDFLEVEIEDVNRRQRIILLAEAFDYALLVSAKWLSERFGVDLICCRLSVARDTATNSEFLVCSSVHPAPELMDQAIPRGRKVSNDGRPKWSDWEAALEDVNNSALVGYFQQQLANGRESYLAKRILRYRSRGKRHWFMAARRKNAYVWQQDRFIGDLAFWNELLGSKADVKPVKDGQCLRMFLHTPADFSLFNVAVDNKLQAVEWLTPVDPVDSELLDDEPRL